MYSVYVYIYIYVCRCIGVRGYPNPPNPIYLYTPTGGRLAASVVATDGEALDR